MKKLLKSGFISWHHVCIIVAQFDCLLFNNSLVTLLALSSLLDSRAQVLLVCTVWAPNWRKPPVPFSSLAMHVRAEAVVAGIGHGYKTKSKVLVGPALQITRGFNNCR